MTEDWAESGGALMKFKARLLTGSVAAFALMGCQSRFSEPAPDSVTAQGISLDERIAQKERIDLRMNEAQRGAEKARRVLEVFRKALGPSAGALPYTPLDFILDINAELMAKIPVPEGDRLVRHVDVELPAGLLPEECRIVKTKLESAVLYADTQPSGEKTITRERLTYLVKTCKSGGEYLPAFEADWIGPTFKLRLMKESLLTIFEGLGEAAVATLAAHDKATCTFTTTQSDKTLKSIECAGLEFGISKSEIAKLTKLAFNNAGEPRAEVNAEIFENDSLKLRATIQVLQSGEVLRDLKRIGPSTEKIE